MMFWGIGWPNGPTDVAERERIVALGLHEYVILDAQIDVLPWLVARDPQAVIHLRIDRRGALDAIADAAAINAILASHGQYIYSIRIRNEPNIESAGQLAKWYGYLVDLRRLVPSGHLWIPAISPGLPDFLDWIGQSARAAIDAGYAGIDVHAYGWPGEIEMALAAVRQVWKGRLLCTEVNFGAGRTIDVAAYAAQIPEILRVFERRVVEAACWFIWRWQNPDSSLKTTVDLAQLGEIQSAMRSPNVPNPPPAPAPVIKPAPGYPVVDNAKIFEYAQWSLARIKNNEDPRDVGAFAQHLKDLGADAQHPEAYGLPFELRRPLAP